MITPPYLQPGDTVGIVCTARKITAEELQPAINIIEGWGFKVKLGNTIGLSDNQFGGDDAARTADLQAMLDDKTVKAVFCARGGYGTVRMVDRVNYQEFENKPKWIVGYSDITVLHAKASQLNVESLHASMPVNFATNTPGALDSIRKALIGEKINYAFPAHELNRTGTCKGKLVGGNLSVLYSISGSESDIQTEGNILFLEDLDEYLYHIDRMMMQLKRAGKLEKLAGLIIGGMTDMNDNTIPFGKTGIEIIREHVDEYPYPVAFNLPAGHLADNRALIMGREVTLEVKVNESNLMF